MQILDLNQFILRAEQRVFRVEHGQHVDGSCRHLRLRELKRAARPVHRLLLARLLLVGLLGRDQCVFDIAERRDHRLVIGAQQFGIVRVAECNLAAQSAAVKYRLRQSGGSSA